jgi:hypothetical protein
MPVTRDLSPAKRAAILEWLSDPLPGPVREAAMPAPRAEAPQAPDLMTAALKGGKSAAAARRLVLQFR